MAKKAVISSCPQSELPLFLDAICCGIKTELNEAEFHLKCAVMIHRGYFWIIANNSQLASMRHLSAIAGREYQCAIDEAGPFYKTQN